MCPSCKGCVFARVCVLWRAWCLCVRACVRACVCACLRVCVWVGMWSLGERRGFEWSGELVVGSVCVCEGVLACLCVVCRERER
jgi:hypothetical protein